MTSAAIPGFMICASIWSKPACRAPLAGALRDQDPGRAHHRIDEVTRPQKELLHAAAHAGTDDGFLQLHLGLRQRGFGARLFGREQARGPRLGGLSRRGGRIDRALAASHRHLELLDITPRDDARIAPVQLLLGIQFVHGLLERTLGLLDLSFSLRDIELRHHHFRLDLRNLASGGLHGCLLLRIVEPEERRSLGDRAAIPDIDLGDAADCLRNDRDGSEEQCDVGRRRVVVEDHRDQPHGEHQAGRDAPPQLEPHRVERDFLAEPPSLDVTAKEIVGKNCHERAEEHLEHGSAPSCLPERVPVVMQRGVGELLLRHGLRRQRPCAQHRRCAPVRSVAATINSRTMKQSPGASSRKQRYAPRRTTSV